MIDFFAAFMVVEVNRIIFRRNPTSFLPMYLSNFPYLIFHLLSGSAHIIFGPIFFVTIIAIFLQMGSEKMGFHVIMYCLSYLGN
jgi:hypothetical protein